MAKLKLPKDCLKSDVCRFVGDSGCLEGCDYRLEQSNNSDSEKSCNNSKHKHCSSKSPIDERPDLFQPRSRFG